jgi:MFS family permease
MSICATCTPGTRAAFLAGADLFQIRAAGAAAPSRQALLTAVVIDAVTGGAFFPLVFLYLSASTALPVASIGLLLSAGGFAALLFNPLTGTVVDRIGAGRTLLVANVLAAVGFAGLFRVSSVLQLGGAIALVSLSQRLYWSAWPVFLAEQVPAGAALDRWFGLVNAVKSGALGLGSAAAAVLLAVGTAEDLRLLVALAVLGSLACALVLRGPVARTLRRTARAAQRGDARAAARGGWGVVLADRPYLAITASHTALTFAWLLLGLALPMYLVTGLGLPPWLPSAALALNTALTVLLQQRVTARLQGWRRTRAILLGTGAFVLAFALLGLVAVLPAASPDTGLVLVAAVLLVAVALYALGEMAVGPAASALAVELSPVPLRGRYSALFQTSWTLSSVTGPVAIGLLLTWSSTGLWVVMGAVVALGGLGFWLSERWLPASVTGRPRAQL